MTAASTELMLKKLSDLRAELVDLAFTMDRRGRLDAADVAMTASARVGELCEEFKAGRWMRHSPDTEVEPTG
jgi:hypothetical protein